MIATGTDAQSNRKPLAWRVGAIAIGFAAFALWASAPANAGTYLAAQCDTRYQSDTPEVAFTQTGGFFTDSSTCTNTGNPGSAGLQLITPDSGHFVPGYSQFLFSAPSGLVFSGVDLSYVLETAHSFVSELHIGGPGFSDYWSPLGIGTHYVPNGVWQHLASAGTELSYVLLQLRCPWHCTNFPEPTHQIRAAFKALDFTVNDRNQPTLSVGGEILSGGVRRGIEELTAAASDAGGGVHRITATVNGTALPQKVSACQLNAGAAMRFRPCPPTSSASYTLNTEEGPWRDGVNEVSVCSFDYARSGPNATCETRQVEVDNSCPKSDGAAPASALGAGLQDKAGALQTATGAKSTEGIPLKGNAISSSGAPVSGATVCLFEKIDAPEEARQLVQQAKTRSDGGFSVIVPPGASRIFDVVYRYNSRTIEKQLYLDSEAVPTLELAKKKLKNGRTMKFGGTIPAARAADRQVTVQAKIGKTTWRTFKQLKTDKDGRFSGVYRFKRSTLPRAKYTFRALVKKQQGYPYSPGISNTAKLIVFGKRK